jgi:threonine/homoserine/homoserine lactone efflux protein
MIEMMISSFVVGFLVAIPPGTVTVVAAQKSILYGFKNSLSFTFGSCISDIFYILLVFFGLAPLFNHSLLLKIMFWYASSILLFYFGFDALRALKNRTVFSDSQMGTKALAGNILYGVLVTLTNPLTIAGWLVIAGGFFTHWNQDWPSIQRYGLLSIISIMLGVLCWFIPMLFIVSKAKSFLNGDVIKILILLSGLFFLGLGLFSIFSATKLLFN